MGIAGFDFDGARKAGATDDQILDFIGKQKGLKFDVGGALDAGATPTEVVDFMRTNADKVFEGPGLFSLATTAAKDFVVGAGKQTAQDIKDAFFSDKSVMDGATPAPALSPNAASPVAPMRKSFYGDLQQAERAAPERAAERAQAPDVVGTALRDIRAKRFDRNAAGPEGDAIAPVTVQQDVDIGQPQKPFDEAMRERRGRADLAVREKGFDERIQGYMQQGITNRDEAERLAWNDVRAGIDKSTPAKTWLRKGSAFGQWQQSIADAMDYHLPASIAASLKGANVSLTDDKASIADALIRRGEQRTEDRLRMAKDLDKPIFPGLTTRDVIELGPNLGYTLVAGGIVAATGGLGLLPSGIIGFAAMKRMDENQVTRQLRIAANDEALSKTGRPLTDAQWAEKLDQMKDEIAKHGDAEGIFEYGGTAAEIAILKSASSIFGTSWPARVVSKLMALGAMELTSEAATQISQKSAEVRMGLGDKGEQERSYASLSDWVKSAREVAPQTLLLTATFGGVGAGVRTVYERGIADPRLADQVKRAAAEGMFDTIPLSELKKMVPVVDAVAKRRGKDAELRDAAKTLRAARDAKQAEVERLAQVGSVPTEAPSPQPVAGEQPAQAEPGAPQPSPQEVAGQPAAPAPQDANTAPPSAAPAAAPQGPAEPALAPGQPAAQAATHVALPSPRQTLTFPFTQEQRAAFDEQEHLDSLRRDAELASLAAEAAQHRQDEEVGQAVLRTQLEGFDEQAPTARQAAVSSFRFNGKKMADISDTGLRLLAAHGSPEAKAAAGAELANRAVESDQKNLDEGGVAAVEFRASRAILARLERSEQTKMDFVPHERAPKAAQRAARAVNAIFGTDVIFTDSLYDTQRGLGFDAMYDTATGSVVVNVNSTRAWEKVLGHELLHVLRRSNPQVYNDLLKNALASVRIHGEGGVADVYDRSYHDVAVASRLEEMVADLMGEHMDSPKFWLEVFRATPKSNVKALYRTLMMGLDAVRLKIRIGERRNTEGFDTHRFVTDVEAIRKAVASAYAQWQVEAQGKKAAEPARALPEQAAEPVNSVDVKPEGGPSLGLLYSRAFRNYFDNRVAAYERAPEGHQKRVAAAEMVAVAPNGKAWVPEALSSLRYQGKPVFAHTGIIGTVATIYEKGRGIHMTAQEGRTVVPLEILSNLDDYLAKPIGVYRADAKGTNPDSVRVLVAKMDSGQYVDVAIDSTKKYGGVGVNFILTVTPRDQSQVDRWEREGLRLDKKKTPDNAGINRQGPGVVASGSGDELRAAEPATTIPRSEHVVKPKAHRQVDELAHEAATSPTNTLPEPTPAQRDAGVYRKGHIRIAGLDISIENLQGSIRTWKKPDGTRGESVMRSHYGYVRATEGMDGEPIDVFVRPGTPIDYAGSVFVVDQNKLSGRADEHKIMLGWPTELEAKAAYLENYQHGWNGLHAVTRFENPAALKEWLASDETDQRAVMSKAGRWYYSELEKQIEAKSPGTASPGMWQLYLSGLSNRGVKKDEIEWSGVREFLSFYGVDVKVTKEQVLGYLKSNGVQIEEVQLIDNSKANFEAADQALIAHLITNEHFTDRSAREYARDALRGTLSPKQFEAQSDITRELSDELERRYELLDGGPHAQEGETRFHYWQLPGGQNYREIALTLPGPKMYRVPRSHEMGKQADVNRLSNIRFNERTDATGARVLFIEELQSDWGQRIHKEKNDYKKLELRKAHKAPFVTKTEAWVALSLKRMIRYAAENGFDKVAWTTGDQQSERYGLAEKKAMGMKAFYDKIVPNVANDVLKKLGGGRVEEVNIGQDRESAKHSIKERKIGGFVARIGTEAATFSRLEDANAWLNERLQKGQPGFAITPAMRQRAMEGQPLFSRADRAERDQTQDTVGPRSTSFGNTRYFGEGILPNLWGHDILGQDGQIVGSMTLSMNDGKPIAMANVEIAETERLKGYAESAVLDAIREAPNGELYIVNIQPEAIGFWKKMGVTLDEGNEWAYGNGLATQAGYEAARGKTRSEAGKAAGAGVGAAEEENRSLDFAKLSRGKDQIESKARRDKQPARSEGSSPVAGSIAAAARARPIDFDGMSDGLLRLVSRSHDPARAKAAQIEMARRQREAMPAEAGTDTAQAAPLRDDARSPLPDESPADAQRANLPGAQYTGFVFDAQSTPAARTVSYKVITREEVLAPFLKALGIPVYEGRLEGGNRLGYFRPKKEVVRIKNASDLETTAHEVAHAVDDRVFNGFGTQKGVARTRPWVAGPDHQTYSAELRGLSYDQTKSHEGFAEFVRLWMTQPEKAAAAAPKFNEWFNNFVGKHEYGPALLQAREGMLSWFGQDPLARARSKIGEKGDINQFLNGFWDRFRQSTSDDLHGIYRMERELSGGIKPQGAYETARLTRASHSMMEGLLRQGRLFRKPDGSFDYVGKGLEQILKPVSGHLDDFMMYAVGRSANELMGQGREHLFTAGEIKAMLALETPEFKRAFFDYQLWNLGTLDFAEQAGVLNPQTRKLWKRAEYLPFYRVGQAGSERSMGGVEGNWKGIQKLTGGSENLRDVLGNIVQNASMLIDVSLKNEARAKIVALANSTHGGGHFLEKIPAESRKVKIERDQVRDKLMEAAGTDGKLGPGDQAKLSHYIDALFEDTPYLWDFLVKNQAPTGGKVFAVLSDGKPSYYEVVDPILYRAVSALNRPAQSEIVKLLGIPKRIGQASITLTPDFAIANIARDTIMGAIMSRGGFRPVIDSIRGMAGRITKDPAYREYVANGGGFSSYFVDENAFRAHLERFYHDQGIDPKTVIDAPSKFLYFAENIADSFEVSTRLGEYKRLREQGEHPRHAAYLAREVSTDFAMRGDSATLGFLYDTVIFLRPAVVSMDRLYRGLAHDPNRGMIAAKSAALALASGALYLLNRDNEKYKDMEDWDRDSYWHFFIPKGDGSEFHFRYPKIWEVGMMATLAERALERTLDAEPKEYAKDLARVIGQQFGLNFMPQAVAPLYEQATNRLSFTKRPIEPQNLQQLQPFMRANPSTSESMRALGMATKGLPQDLQISPARAESLLRGYLNTWALYGLMLSDAALFGDKAPERRLDQYPVLRRFMREEPPIHTKHEAKFYELLQETEQLRASYRKLRQLGEDEAAATIAQNPVAQQAMRMKGAQRILARTRKEVERIRNSDLPPDEKRRQLDQITAKRNSMFKGVATSATEAIKRREANPEAAPVE